MNKKRRSEIPAAPFLFVAVGCGRRHLKFSRLSFPADRQLPRGGRFERVLNERFANGACRAAFGFALQRNNS